MSGTATPSPTAGGSSGAVAALQAALAGEHAAIYGYGVVGARLDGGDRSRAEAAYSSHRARRDQLRRLIRAENATPVAAAAGYALPRPVETPADARLLAIELEERLAAVWLDAVAALRGELRELAARVLQDTAVRAADWRGGSVSFPGLPQGPRTLSRSSSTAR